MLLTFRVLRHGFGCVDIVHCFPLPQIKEREYKHPHQIDEVPVQPGDLNRLVSALAIVETGPDSAGDDAEIDHAGRYVQAVKTGNHEKGRAELRCAHRIVPRTHTFMDDELSP